MKQYPYKYTNYDGDVFLGWVNCEVVERRGDWSLIKDENGKEFEYLHKRLCRNYEVPL